MSVTTLSGTMELDALSLGTHTITGYVARPDGTKITGSDSATITFTMTAAAPPPVLSFSSPANNAVLNSSTVTVAFSSSGDLSQANHAHIILDGVEVAMTTGLSGTTQLTGVTAGLHTLGGYLARADHSKVTGSDAPSRQFTVSIVNPNDPSIVGQWSPTIVQLPTVAVNLNLMHTGQALFWAGDFESAANYGELWNPANNAITDVPNPFSNIFCSAAVHLADGRLLVAGGHDKANGVMGIADSNTFDPVTQTWQSLPDMAFRRWYATLTMLGDGKAIILAGSANSETVNIEIPEIFDPVARTWTRLNGATMSIPQYPMVYLLADGRLLQSGTVEHPTATRTLNIATQTWTTIDSRLLEGGSGVMYAPGRMMKSGSSSNDGATPNADSTATTYVLNMNEASPAWRQTTSMAYPRTFHNLTSLADGTVLVTSGSRKKSETNLSVGVVQAELWSPESESWTTMAPAQNPRIYHSTAVLLPDARVAVSGSGNIAGGTDQTNLEIYSPPYLFKGPRPTITSAPSLAKYGNSFFVQTPDGADIRSVNLIRPGAATHSFDQDQRFVPVTFNVVSGGIQVNAPSNPNLLPPGHYMLFLVSNAGVPSVAKFVRFPAPYEDSEPPSAPGNLQGTGNIGSGSLSWTAATDNVGVVRYEIYRSTSSSFTPSAANLIGQTTGTTYSDAGLPAGTYYYIVLAVDAVGSKSVASNTVSVTVQADTLPPTVAIAGLADGSTVSGTFTLQANASDNVLVAGVTFRLDGVAIMAEDTHQPVLDFLGDQQRHEWGACHHGCCAGRSEQHHDVRGGECHDQQLRSRGSGRTHRRLFLRGRVGHDYSRCLGSVEHRHAQRRRDLEHGGQVRQGRVLQRQQRHGDRRRQGLAGPHRCDDAVCLGESGGDRRLAHRDAQGSRCDVCLRALQFRHRVTAERIHPYGQHGASVTGSSALPANTWSHLAATYDGSNLRLYVNGTLVRTRPGRAT